jgi:hypothetical protein
MPHVVQPRPVTIGRAAQPDLPRQSVERPADVAAIQPVAPTRRAVQRSLHEA